jgi:hypothetical protein
MATPKPITPDSVAKHVQGLLAANVTVKKLPQQELKGTLVVGSIKDESGALVCAIVADIAAAGNLGAALSRIPAGVIQDLVRKGGSLDQDLLENYHEVVNVLTVLTTGALGRRTILSAVEQSKTGPQAATQSLIKDAKTTLFLQLGVQGYASGGVNIYLAS